MGRIKLSSAFIGLSLFFLLLSTRAVAQNSTLEGTVKDVVGTPLIGVNVIQKGTSNGTVTDIDGNFSIQVPEDAVMVFTYIGFSAQEVAWDGVSVMNVIMHEDVGLLDEIVVVGYGTQKKRDVIGCISTISSEDLIKATSAASFDAALQGLAPGLMVSNESGIPGSPVQIKVRGVNSISSGTNPLWIVDGIPIAIPISAVLMTVNRRRMLCR